MDRKPHHAHMDGLFAGLGGLSRRAEPWMSTMPGLAIFVAVMGFNLLGDALDVWDQ